MNFSEQWELKSIENLLKMETVHWIQSENDDFLTFPAEKIHDFQMSMIINIDDDSVVDQGHRNFYNRTQKIEPWNKITGSDIFREVSSFPRSSIFPVVRSLSF